MYFLQQILKQHSLLIAVYIWVEWPREVQQDVIAKIPEAQKTPWEILDTAKKINSPLNEAVSVEQQRLSLLKWDWSDWVSEQWKKWTDTKELVSQISISKSERIKAISEFQWEFTEDILAQKVLENKLKTYNDWQLPREDIKMIDAFFSDAGLENIPHETSVDTLENWEINDVGKDATPEQLIDAEKQVGEEVKNLDIQIAKLAQGPERKILEKRRWLIWSILDILEWKNQQWSLGWTWFAWVESNGSHNVIWTAKNHLGIHENSWDADKFLMWLAQNARKTPWCAGFVSYVCKQAGYDINPTLSSKAFVWETGKWHVAFNVWGWLMLWWNQGNKVSIKSINKPVKWWIMPEDYAAWKPAQKSWNAPVWAIIVFDRSASQKNWV